MPTQTHSSFPPWDWTRMTRIPHYAVGRTAMQLWIQSNGMHMWQSTNVGMMEVKCNGTQCSINCFWLKLPLVDADAQNRCPGPGDCRLTHVSCFQTVSRMSKEIIWDVECWSKFACFACTPIPWVYMNTYITCNIYIYIYIYIYNIYSRRYASPLRQAPIWVCQGHRCHNWYMCEQTCLSPDEVPFGAWGNQQLVRVVRKSAYGGRREWFPFQECSVFFACRSTDEQVHWCGSTTCCDPCR